MAPKDTERAEESRDALPEPPAYTCPYEPGDAGYDMAQRSGYYGIMYAGDYEWDDVRCTKEAYGEYDPTAKPGNRRKTREGKPVRSLKFHSTWLDVATAIECIQHIGDYNRFTPETVAAALDAMPDPVRVVVARESSPAIYVWTVAPATVGACLRGVTPSGDPVVDDARATALPPDELGGVPQADSYPVRTIGRNIEELEDGTPTLIRAWWD